MHEKYTPSFHWKDNALYDGDVEIARLRYDPEAKGHIHLCKVRLTPDGDSLVNWTLSWRFGMYCATSKLQSLNVSHDEPATCRMNLVASSPDDRYTSNTRIDVSFDSQRQCYRYEAVSDLRVNRFPFYAWKQIDSAEFHRDYAFFPSEFANFLPLGSYIYHAPVDRTPKKWQAFVYQNDEGGWSRVPQHHLLTPDKYNIHFPAGHCKLGFVDDPGGNPCIELIERLPSRSQAAVCWCMNDIHLHVDKIPLNMAYRVQYALYQFTPEETAEIADKATGYAYTEEEKALYDRPRFRPDRVCDFETGFNFDIADDWLQFWLPMGETQYTSWAPAGGRGGGRCLKTETPSTARVLWQAEHSNAPVVPPGKRYRITAWIKTNGLQGEAYLEVWDHSCPSAPVRSVPVSAATDWQEVSAEVDVADTTPLPGKISLRLVHEGSGVSWFDDVAVRECRETGE